jgi:hypothetical protein
MTDPELLRQIHNRLDKQDAMLSEIKDRINIHIIESEHIRPALDELVTLWKGSKILIPLMVAMTTAVWAIVSWGKEHLR